MNEKSITETVAKTATSEIPGSNVFDEIVPGVKRDLATYAESESGDKEIIGQYLSTIDMDDSKSIIFFAVDS